LPISTQTEILQICRSSVYFKPRPIPEANLLLIRRIDELHLNYPFAGSRMLRDLAITRPNQVWSTDISYSTPSQRISIGRRCAA
jgi:transposase InsO family protein